MNWTDIPKGLLTDLAQLTKANSIEGNKKDNITVIYTPWRNLKKNKSMAAGEVYFYRPDDVRKVFVEKRANEIVNRLNKTRTVKDEVDFAAEKEQMLKEQKRKEREAVMKMRKEQDTLRKEAQRAKKEYQKGYDEMFTQDNIAQASNQDRSENWDEDDFM